MVGNIIADDLGIPSLINYPGPFQSLFNLGLTFCNS